MCRLKFCRDLKARIAMRARWVLQNRSRRRGNRMRKGGENKVGQSFWYWWFGESGERGGPAGGEEESIFSQSKERLRRDGMGQGMVPPGSNIREVTAQLERPRRGPEVIRGRMMGTRSDRDSHLSWLTAGLWHTLLSSPSYYRWQDPDDMVFLGCSWLNN